MAKRELSAPWAVAWALVAFAGCAGPVATRGPAADPARLTARWTLTRSTLHGDVFVAPAGGALYVKDCDRRSDAPSLTVSKLDADGWVEWQRRLPDLCGMPDIDRIAYSLAASHDGPVVAVKATPYGQAASLHLVALDPEGARRWARTLPVYAGDLRIAASPGRVALCFSSSAEFVFDGASIGAARFGMVVLELDGRGSRIASHLIENVGDVSCTYDGAGDLWLTTNKYTAIQPLVIDGQVQSLEDGVWAIRFKQRPELVLLHRSPLSSYQDFPSGIVVYMQNESLSFVDRTGTTRWRVPAPRSSCTAAPYAIDASPTRLIARIAVGSCPASDEPIVFGDVDLRAQVGRRIDMTDRDFVVELDPIARAVRSAQLARPRSEDSGPLSASYVMTPFGVLAFGQFEGAHLLDPSIRSEPTYLCNEWNGENLRQHRSETPSCTSGRLETRYEWWPFVSLLR